ncbi:MAG TPA: IPExxxVDY family protein [Cyclobacteriaceae bacterium]|nr:IPExxxVDY family protein [Cyclobacteriaceae bacterium]HRK53285.1 IPExxxVDY family protein [Cyclobacteriaceae bacterium]
MKKKRLDIEYSYDFELLGVISSAKGYKLAWDINSQLGVRLVKQPDVHIQFNNNITGSYAHFFHETPLNRLRLFRNKSTETEAAKNFLIQEYPHLDYVIMSQGADKFDIDQLQKQIRSISSVEMVAFIPLDTLKSKDYFIF